MAGHGTEKIKMRIFAEIPRVGAIFL